MYNRFLYVLIILCFNAYQANATLITDYLTSVGKFLGYNNAENINFEDDILGQSVPYEVSIADEKFIHEAAKLTGVELSVLDSCQHRVSIPFLGYRETTGNSIGGVEASDFLS